MRRRRLILAPALATALVAGACGDDGTPASGTTEAWSTCTEERDGWERCEDGNVIWCHAFGTPHFHTGARCASAGFECVSITESRAVCSSPDETCEDGEFSCRENTALNCLDGQVALWPCGTRLQCMTEPSLSLATCWDPSPTAPCSGHGDLYESGCVCNPGYQPTEDGEGCVP